MSDTQKIAYILDNLKKPVVFIGMMGAGKTTIARKFAEKLGWNFLDSDLEIEAEERRSVREIFSGHGEPYFRVLEEKKISGLLNKTQCVLSVGGGAVTSPRTCENILSQSLCLWLDAPLNILAQRAGGTSTRPLLAGGNINDILKERMEQRRPLYEKAHIHVDGAKGIEAVTDNAIGQVYEYLLKIKP